MKAILPEAEKAGVKMALHPDDPPVACVSGVARIFNSFESYVRADRETNSPAWGVDLCLGCCSEMGGAPVVERFIDYFGHRGKIFYVHFRDVLGVPDDFRECYLGLRAMSARITFPSWKMIPNSATARGPMRSASCRDLSA